MKLRFLIQFKKRSVKYEEKKKYGIISKKILIIQIVIIVEKYYMEIIKNFHLKNHAINNEKK